jgi:hypothetical protein
VPCEVTAFTRHEFDCTIKPKSAVSDLTKAYAGQHGVSRWFINKTSSLNYWKIDEEPSVKMLALDMAAERNIGDYMGSIYKAWFVPPKTARYRFYMVCNDYCLMEFATCPKSHTPTDRILDLRGWTDYSGFFSQQHHWNKGKKKISDWLELTEGEEYFMQVNYMEYNWHDHMRTAVEIE